MSNIETPHHFVPLSLSAALRDRYEVVRETGSGGSATVYLAKDLKHQRLVALKVLNPDVGQVGGARFLREIQVSAAMQHPHILPMYDSGVADGRLYFVMPFVDGGSLRQRLEAEPQLPVAEAVRIAREIAVALSFAHAQGVVHRDVKPENILFYHGQPCLADFGIARVVEQLDSRVTAHDTVVGTPAYMSPEQMAHGGFDARSDVYSLAVVLYEMIAGGPAHTGTTPSELLRQRLKERPEPVHQKRGGIPTSLDALLSRALSPSPHERFDDAGELASALESVLRELSGARPVGKGAPVARSTARPPASVWATAAVALVLVSGTLAFATLDRGVWTRLAPLFAKSDLLAEGRDALAQWKLDQAEKAFSAATRANPDSPPARLWLAQTFALERRADSEQFRLTASRLGTFAGLLRGRDSLLASGLIALASHDFPRACDAYERLRAADSLDALAWYGLGDCQYLDDAVVRDPRSPSGWRFRTSWPAAARAYMRAVEVEPASHRAVPYALLTLLLPTDPTFIRIGRSTDGKATFAAYPSMAGDSAVHVPWPAAELSAGAPRTLSPSIQTVLQRNREQLLAFARMWVAAAPQSADAYEALALAHEARGELGADSNGASMAVERARALSQSPIQQVRLAAFTDRIALKTGDFARARAIADSLLDSWARRDPPAPIARRLSGLAALTGRIADGARLMAIWTAEPNADNGIAPALTDVSSRLFVRAAVGVCDDSLLVLRGRADALLESYTSPNLRDSIRASLVGRAAALSFPCLGGRVLQGLRPATPLDRAQRAMAAHDRRRVRAILDSVEGATRRFYRPGDVSLDYTVQEASLLASLGDTASARRSLQLVLDALPTLGSLAVFEEAQAAAVSRALELDAELEAASGNRALARRRATDALVLLQHADPALGPTAARLRALRDGAL